MEIQRRIAAPVAAGLVLAFAAGAVGYAATSHPAVSSSNVDVVRTRSTQKDLGGGGYVNVTVLSVSLPAGSWVVTANATILDYSGQDEVRCGIYRGSTPLDTAFVSAGDIAGPAASVGAIGSFKSSATTTVSLRCAHGLDTAHPVVDVGAVLWAHRSSNLSRT
jgi:hypothetical protein